MEQDLNQITTNISDIVTFIIEVFEKIQEEIRARSNIEIIDGKVKRKNTHYSSRMKE